MKTKQQKLTSKSIVIVPALILLVVLGTALAKPARSPVVGSGQADAYMDLGYAVGTVNIAVRGVQMQATVVVTLDPPRYSDEGVLHATSEHIFYFGSGDSFTTEDKIVGEPTSTPGLLVLNETLKIVSGTGIFAGASGSLTVHGFVNFINLTDAIVTYDIRGSITTP